MILRIVLGRDDSQKAKRLKPRAAASVSMWPASASRARLPLRNPPATSTSIMAAVITRGILRVFPLSLRSWDGCSVFRL
jgi:hypothetical protein